MASTVQSARRPAGSSGSGNTPTVTRVPPGVVRSSVVNSPAATLTSRATRSTDVQVRRPSWAADGSAWSPVIRTVSCSGADTVICTAAAELVAVSPRIPTNGSRAQPAPGSQASSGAPLAHQVTPSSVPTRSKVPRAEGEREGQLDLGGLPRRELAVEVDDVQPARVATRRRPRSRRRPRRRR